MNQPWQADALAGLGGAHWGLLPALFFIPLFAGQENWATSLGMFLWLAAIMASYDLAIRRIPNLLTGAGALLGLATAMVLPDGIGLTDALLGGLTGFALMAVFFFLGAVGGGDVKALGALGVFVGPMGALALFVYTALAGGIMALALLLYRRRGTAVAGGSVLSLNLAGGGKTMPYALAILAGALILAVRGGVT